MLRRGLPSGSVAGRAGLTRGFTLVELMVTLSLLALLVKLGLPSFSAMVGNAKVRTVAESLQTGLRTAQAEAVRRNRTVALSFTNLAPAQDATPAVGGKNWSLQTVPSLGDASAEFLGGGALSDVAAGVSIAAAPATSVLCFDANGRVSTNATAGCTAAVTSFDISLATSDRPLRVIVQIGGQLRTCDPNRPTLSAATPDGCPTP